MSTKIYNAFKFKKSHSDLMPFLTEIKNIVESETINYILKFEIKDDIKYSEIIKVLNELENNSILNLKSSIVVYFHKNDIYLHFFLPIFYSDKSLRLFTDYLEDFHYQDQCDRPDDISDGDWEHRCTVWKEIFSGNVSYIPLDSGVVWHINRDLNYLALKIYDEVRGNAK